MPVAASSGSQPHYPNPARGRKDGLGSLPRRRAAEVLIIDAWVSLPSRPAERPPPQSFHGRAPPRDEAVGAAFPATAPAASDTPGSTGSCGCSPGRRKTSGRRSPGQLQDRGRPTRPGLRRHQAENGQQRGQTRPKASMTASAQWPRPKRDGRTRAWKSLRHCPSRSAPAAVAAMPVADCTSSGGGYAHCDQRVPPPLRPSGEKDRGAPRPERVALVRGVRSGGQENRPYDRPLSTKPRASADWPTPR